MKVLLLEESRKSTIGTEPFSPLTLLFAELIENAKGGCVPALVLCAALRVPVNNRRSCEAAAGIGVANVRTNPGPTDEIDLFGGCC